MSSNVQVDEALVRHVASLANLDLSEDEVAHYQTQLKKILSYVDQLKELDGVAEGSWSPSPTPERDDQIQPSLAPEDALSQAPSCQGTSFQVPKFMD